jgi:hypothetical protein
MGVKGAKAGYSRPGRSAGSAGAEGACRAGDTDEGGSISSFDDLALVDDPRDLLLVKTLLFLFPGQAR